MHITYSTASQPIIREHRHGFLSVGDNRTLLRLQDEGNAPQLASSQPSSDSLLTSLLPQKFRLGPPRRLRTGKSLLPIFTLVVVMPFLSLCDFSANRLTVLWRRGSSISRHTSLSCWLVSIIAGEGYRWGRPPGLAESGSTVLLRFLEWLS
jgi:hypothetical protein